MGKAKEIVLKVIPASIANPFIRAHHYSGGVVTNSCLHFGVFLDGQLHGVMSYGPSMNKQKMHDIALALMAVQTQTTDVLSDFPTKAAEATPQTEAAAATA